MSEAPQRKRYSRLLIVEDDDAQRSTLTNIMQDQGFEVESCAKAAEALEHLNRQAFSVVIADQRLPDFSGIQLLEKIRATGGRVPVIVHTGYGSFDSAKSAVNLGAFAYVEKLGDPAELVRQVHRAFRDGLSSYAEDLEAEVARRTASLQESEERFRRLYERTPIAYQSLDERGHILEVNQAWLDTLGYTRDEVLGRWFGDFLSPEYVEHFRRNFPSFKSAGEIHHVQFEMKRKDGSRIAAEYEGRIGYDEYGEFQQTHCTFQDITERKRAEEKLRRSEERFDLAVQGSQDGLWDWDLANDRQWWSPTVYALLGYQDGEIEATSANFRESLHPDHKEAAPVAVRAHLKDRVPYDVEYLLRTKSGEYRWFRGRGQALWDKDGKPVRMSGSIRDVTDRKRAEEALQEKTRLQQIFLDNLPQLAMLLRPKTREIVATNRAGLEVGAAPGQTCFGTWGQSDSPCPWCLAPKVWETGEAQHLQPEGVGRIWDAHWIPISDDLYLHYAYDITEQKRAEGALRRSNRALKVLSKCNEALVRATDENELLGRVCEIIVESGGYQLAWVGLAEQDEAKSVRPVAHWGFDEGYLDSLRITWADTERGRGPTGTAIRTGIPTIARDILSDPQFAPWRDAAVERAYQSSIALPLMDEHQPLGALNIYASEADTFDDEETRLLRELATDLAYGVKTLRTREEHRKAEQELAKYRDHLEELVDERTRALEQSRTQLQAARRLASVGTLAAGIAHEINNPVGAILLAAENLLAVKGQPKAEQLMDSCLSSIVGNARRCSKITRSVLQFARQETTDKWPNHLHRIIGRAVELAHPRAQDDGGLIEMKLADTLPEVVMNPIEIEQVFVNLIRNALESAPRGVHVRISTQAASEAVRIVVEDNGRGIPPEHLARIYDPFFTTRREEGGTGLGLSIVHGIIAGHGGSIDVESRVGRGTVFTMTFPLAPTRDREVVRGQALDR